MDSPRVQTLREAAANEALSPERRAEAAALLAEMEKAPPAPPGGIWAEVFRRIDERYAAYVENENARLKVCPSCYRKQPKDRQACELCGSTPESWEWPVHEPYDPMRGALIAAATNSTPEELNAIIANDSIRLGLVRHCARVLELRGIPRVRSFWERAGCTIDGAPVVG